MANVNVGLIGSGFMGRAHAYALRAAPGVFELPRVPVLELLADIDIKAAQRASAALGFARFTDDWHALVGDPAVDLVDITSPNHLHKEMALAAIAHGKPVYCEKPLAPTATAAKQMVDAAKAAGVVTMVGFNYLKNPMVLAAREMIRAGEIGEVIGYRGCHFEDYMIDAEAPWTWRLDPAGGDGVVGDLMSHAISLARFLVGDIAEVMADSDTAIKTRPVAPGSAERRAVEVSDQARALVRFADGARGTLEASWVATGRKMQLAFEVTGTKGALILDHERLNELRYYTTGQPSGREGFKTLLASAGHPPYANFTPAPGHQIGFNEVKMIEVAALMAALAGEAPAFPDFREAWEVQRVVDATVRAAAEQRWVPIAEV